MNFKKKIILFFCAIIAETNAYADNVIHTYKTEHNKIKETTLTSSLLEDGKPLVTSYKDSNGQWHNTTVIQQICGLNTDSTPIACNTDLSNYIKSSLINKANGIAGINNNGEIISPINTSNAYLSSSITIGNGGNILTYSTDKSHRNSQYTSNDTLWDMIYGDPSLHISSDTGTANLNLHGGLIIRKAEYIGFTDQHSVPVNVDSRSSIVSSAPVVSINSGWNDPYMSQGNVMFGGHNAYDSSHVVITGAPGSFGQDGCILDVEMSNMPWFANRCGSGVHDAVAQFVKASNTPPRYRVGSEIKDENGVTHTLSFTATTVIAKPALPASLAGIWHPSGNGYWSVTNIKQADPSYDPEDNKNSGGPRPIPNLYSGYIVGYSNEKDKDGSSITVFNVPGGWHSLNDYSNKNASDIPSTTNTDLDKIWYPQFKKPVLIIGTYTIGFAQNWRCFIDRPDPSSYDYTTYGSALDAPMTGCQGVEFDAGASGVVSNGSTVFRGFTAGLSMPNNVLPSGNSAGFIAQGPWAIGVQTGLGVEGYDFEGSVFNAAGRKGPNDTVGSISELAEFRQNTKASVDTSSDMIHMRVVQSVDSSGTDGTAGSHTYQDNALHIGSWYGGDTFAQTALGTYMGDVVINPGWLKGGIALCGKDHSLSSSNSGCFTVSNNGRIVTSNSTDLHGDTTLYDGKSLYFRDNTNEILDAIHDDTTNGLTANRLHVDQELGISGSLIIPFGTPSTSASSCKRGQIEMDNTYIYTCVSENTWHRTNNGSSW